MNKYLEWLKEEIGDLPCVDTVFNSDGSSYIDSAVPVMAVYDLITQLDETEVLSQELPAIPKFVANWIEGNKQLEEMWNDYSKEDAMNDIIHFTIYGLFADYPDTNSHVELRKPVLKWLGDDRGNYFKLVNAVQYGYEVEEKEQKYIVKLPLPEDRTSDFAVVDIYGDIWRDGEWPSHCSPCKMTEKEIKALPKGEAYFEHFAVKVEEME